MNEWDRSGVEITWNGINYIKEIKRKTSKPAGKTARNKKAMLIAFLFRCYKTARGSRAVLYSGRVKGARGRREGHWSFLLPRRGLSGLSGLSSLNNSIVAVCFNDFKSISVNMAINV